MKIDPFYIGFLFAANQKDTCAVIVSFDFF